MEVCPLPPNVIKSHRCYDTIQDPGSNCDAPETAGGLGPTIGQRYQAYA